jgi:hypothetical protein
MEFFPEKYEVVLKEAAGGSSPLHVLEEEAFGMNYAEIGGRLCKHWKIPTSLTRMVSEHHIALNDCHADSREDRRVTAVRVADNLARIVQIGNDGETHVETDFLRILDANEIFPEHLRQILLSLPEEVRKTEVFFNLVPASDLDKIQVAPSHATGVFLGDPKEREIVRLILLTLGYTLIPTEQIRTLSTSLVGVVADESLPADMKEVFKQRQVPILDFCQWRNEKGGADKVNIGPLRTWLNKNLTQSQSP